MRAQPWQNESDGHKETRPYRVQGCVRDLCSGLLHRIVFGVQWVGGPVGGWLGCNAVACLSVTLSVYGACLVAQCRRVVGQALVFVNGHALNIWCVWSAAQKCTLSVEALNFD